MFESPIGVFPSLFSPETAIGDWMVAGGGAFCVVVAAISSIKLPSSKLLSMCMLVCTGGSMPGLGAACSVAGVLREMSHFVGEDVVGVGGALLFKLSDIFVKTLVASLNSLSRL